jgi:hypothetical protein
MSLRRADTRVGGCVKVESAAGVSLDLGSGTLSELLSSYRDARQVLMPTHARTPNNFRCMGGLFFVELSVMNVASYLMMANVYNAL